MNLTDWNNLIKVLQLGRRPKPGSRTLRNFRAIQVFTIQTKIYQEEKEK